jgi:hypothetical protein
VTDHLQLRSRRSPGDCGLFGARRCRSRKPVTPKPEFHVVHNAGHFAFPSPDVCTDAPGFDRVAFHKDFDAQVLRFFHEHLVE